MKLGLGLYKHMLTRENYKFAKQAGCTHLVVHLVDYFSDGEILPDTADSASSWGVVSNNSDDLWTRENLQALKDEINDEGLELEAIENFDPFDWYDVLLDGPRKKEQIERLKDVIRIVGDVGIPIIGYNFSLAGVWGHKTGQFARGGAKSVGFIDDDIPDKLPIPNGEIWNMVYNPEASDGYVEFCTTKDLWKRLRDFLEEVILVAEEAGVKLAAHPDDPPMPNLRGYPRLVYKANLYQRLLDIVPSSSNKLEFCLGSLQEMPDTNIYEVLEQYAKQDSIAYIHFRNVKGKIPEYYEVFVDEGDIDMKRILRLLKKNNYQGVLIPDHTPQMACEAPWHAGMAYALGYMRAGLQMIKDEN